MLVWIGIGVMVVICYLLDLPYRRLIRGARGSTLTQYPGRYKNQPWRLAQRRPPLSP